jgi:hypothetical protein
MIPKTIALATPGEHFSSVWLAGYIEILTNLMGTGHAVAPFLGYSSNVYATRARVLESMIDTDERVSPIDYALWLDDDNTLTWPQLQRLIADLDENPDLDAVAAWCWVQADGYACHAIPSCGNFHGHRARPLDLRHLGLVDGAPPIGPDLVPVEYTGFPVVLFRFETLRMLAPLKPFSPYPAEDTEMGFMGEDTGFWMRARHAGMRLAVDRRVKVPHYKLRAAEPAAVTAPQVSLIDNVEATSAR